ncbi:membrane hypothetical protein [Burkholderiales bacterium 8X]|nr:membrane hypothetical protein [Burkholderiales bacterium 8X]
MWRRLLGRSDPRKATFTPEHLDGLEALDKFKLARAYIEHENTLIGQRITWFLTLQGFLFTAFFLTAQLPWKDGKPMAGLWMLADVGTIVIAFLGAGSSLLVFVLLAMALRELELVGAWWAKQRDRGGFPPVTADPSPVNAHCFSIAFVIVWIALAVAFQIAKDM